MKIVSWNCNGAFRNKFEFIQTIDADIYVIQECENPALCKDNHYRDWSCNHLWIGKNKNSGLGVFAKKNINLSILDWDTAGLELFIPLEINKQFTLLAVWTKQANSPTFQYIGQLWKYLQLHGNNLPINNAIVCGDFNSNACWDAWDRWWNHTDVVADLERRNLYSIYHHHYNQAYGSESLPTFYMHRKPERSYHIDYAFVSKELLASATLEIGKPNIWLELSDHMPIIFEILTPPTSLHNT